MVVVVVVVKLEHNPIAPCKHVQRPRKQSPSHASVQQNQLEPFGAPAPEDQIDPRLHTLPVAVVVSLTEAWLMVERVQSDEPHIS